MKNGKRKSGVQKSKRDRRPKGALFDEIERFDTVDGVTIKMKVLKDTNLLEVLESLDSPESYIARNTQIY